MRLLVLSNLYPPVVRGGYEVECRDVVEHLRERHDVTVLASRRGRDEAGVQPGILRLLPWVGDLRKRDAALAAAHAFTARRIVARVLAEVRPDAVYVWNGAGVPAATFRSLQESGLPMLVRVCEYWFGEIYRVDPYTRYLPGGVKAAGRARGLEVPWGAATRQVNRLPGLRVETREPLPASVCWNSAYVAEHAPAPPGVEVRHRAVVLPSTARTDAFAALPRDPRPGRVLFVGRLDERKGAATLVRALARLGETHGIDAELVAVGDGTLAEQVALTALAARLGVEDRLRLTGPLRGQAFEAEVVAASAWAVPSQWDEPAGLVCAEAALARVPAVLSRVGGIPEFLAEDSEALFHTPGDHEACAAALAACLRDDPGTEARVDAAFARAQALTFPRYLRAMDAFLEDGLAALGRRGPSTHATPGVTGSGSE